MSPALTRLFGGDHVSPWAAGRNSEGPEHVLDATRRLALGPTHVDARDLWLDPLPALGAKDFDLHDMVQAVHAIAMDSGSIRTKAKNSSL